VLAVELSGPERLCVYIDHPSGVDHALCERVTDALRSYLAGAVGRTVSVRTDVEVSGRKCFRGEVVEAGEDEATIEIGEERFEVPYDMIVRGNLIEERR
jgi:ribosome maturation factor RimP